MKKAIYFNAKTLTCKTVTDVLNMDMAKAVLASLCRKFGWNVNDVTEIKIV